MEVMTQLVLDDRVWTRAERDALPDDGQRHELLDGMLIVTPAPRPHHQLAVARLGFHLQSVAPPGIRVLASPLDIELAADTVLQPDLVALRREQITTTVVLGIPVLAVEILSPSTRLVDRNLKLPRFGRAGCPSFWLVDPDLPSLTAFELNAAGFYDEVAHVEGDESWTATLPFPVTITPADLLR